MTGGSIRILFYSWICLVGTAIAQNKVAPLPSLVLIMGAHTVAPITVVQTSRGTNFTLTCMTAKSAEISNQQDHVIVSLRDVLAYMPQIIGGNHETGQNLQTVTVGELSFSVNRRELIQINGQIFSAGSIPSTLRRLPNIPARR